MAPLAQTLALLAMAVATVAVDVVTLDMAQNSFDDQYQGCGPAMTAALPALNRSEFQQNKKFAQVWLKAAAEWQSRGSPVSPLSSPSQAVALMAYTMDDLYEEFNKAVRTAGSSSQEYRNNFHFKTLHFLLTDALETLRDTPEQNCLEVGWVVCGIQFKAQSGDTVRFGQFMSTSMSRPSAQCLEPSTLFLARTCHGVDIQKFSYYHSEKELLIPPFETFTVVQTIWDGKTQYIMLYSNGLKSNYNCEWLKGGSIPMAPFHLGGLLLATTALAVATGTL
ncbi:erythroblast NAD(P)(+)--arginine ADP-ribosyltransferase-like [Vidua macroura]|uniref:erythroblast NAD(P)(+)--arginine ADP-ribosyltransferase-like n=1 Tax=Vidua macroura TaxID=187451 RepID=UPI0023A79228|nr:erythroblast NAD(P)(+)--arginine ADP-ribosyltransferase-like [Vidua macroura]